MGSLTSQTPVPIVVDESENVRYSHDVDPGITLDLVKAMEIGERLPNIRGIGMAYYAYHEYPNEADLNKAVRMYLDRKEKVPIKKKKVYTPLWPYEFISNYGRVRVVDWDNDRDGVCICTVQEGESIKPSSDYKNCLDVDASFCVKSAAEAKALVHKICEAVRAFYPNSRIATIHFSGGTAFVSSALKE